MLRIGSVVTLINGSQVAISDIDTEMGFITDMNGKFYSISKILLV